MRQEGTQDVFWNPWHGCTKISPGCMHCYVYRRDEAVGAAIASSQCRKTGQFSLPVSRKRDGTDKIPDGACIYTCFTSDFLLRDADSWREQCWSMMRQRSACRFIFFTKRIERLEACLPLDWGDGYPNVTIGCTVENQAMADRRIPVFLRLPIRHRMLVAEPLLEALDLSAYLGERIEEVCAGGESGEDARPCRYDWILSLREQCAASGVRFRFHQTGARLIKDGREYQIRRADQISQARRAAIDYPGGK